MESEHHPESSWLDRPISFLIKPKLETLIVATILVLAIISRFYHVDLRVMSHDEVNHVVPSYDLYQGRGYRHDPVTHGPLQFHLIALSFFLLGDSDLSARVPAALFSIAAVAFVLFAYKRYLGRTGALIAGFLLLISPFMLYYGRYARNEGIIEFLAVVTLFALLRYLDEGSVSSLYLLTLAVVLHFTSKETSYIYTALLLLFAGLVFLFDCVRASWSGKKSRDMFIILMVVALFLLGIALGMAVWNSSLHPVSEENATLPSATSWQLASAIISLAIAVILGVAAFVTLVRTLGWQQIRSFRSFDILVLIGTLILPQLTAFPVKILGANPLDYSTAGIIRTGLVLLVLTGIAVFIGVWWNPRVWIPNFILFYGIFTVLFTTFFTNGLGFFTGIVGALGYWLAQQGVNRGSQPWYYYALIQIPVYEYLAALGVWLAIFFGIRDQRFSSEPGDTQVPSSQSPIELEKVGEDAQIPIAEPHRVPTLALLVFWAFGALIAFSMAGEKMPWLTVHIALPALLTAGWGLGYLVDSTPWKKVVNRNGLVGLVLLVVLIFSIIRFLGTLFGDQPPFQGATVDQLQATATFLLTLLVAIFSLVGLIYVFQSLQIMHVVQLGTLVFFLLLAILTARTAILASFINYDYATEYMVYAHAAPGPKQVLKQVEEISRRITGGKDIVVAYDNDALYPYWWYLRDYPNKKWYTDKPTRELKDVPLIIAGESTINKMEPIVRDDFVDFAYNRLWWPNQDYFNLTWARIWGAISDPKMRSAIFQIWLNRNYKPYADLTGNANLTEATWQPSSPMHFYIRKDIVSEMWKYGVAPTAQQQAESDPYKDKIQPIQPDLVFGDTGAAPGQFQAPRGLAFAPDGTFYVADSRNNRIQHFSADGTPLQSWGSFVDASTGNAPGGTFNEPWGVGVAPDGSVYVTDTWNHRVQKFTADGKFIMMWGYFGQAEKPEAFWGPRDVWIDNQGRVFVVDTGNKRIVIFDSDGNYINQFGSAGMELGQFDEPVGITLSDNELLYVVDTWNQRIQSFTSDSNLTQFYPFRNWEVKGWYGQSLENKPYIAADAQGNVYVTDPEATRILEFNPDGQYVRGWGEYNSTSENLSIYSGVAIDPQGRIWVTDAANNRIIRFTP